MDHDRMNRCVADANALIAELGDYAALSDRDEEDDAAVRRLRTAAIALVAALDTARLPPSLYKPPGAPPRP